MENVFLTIFRMSITASILALTVMALRLLFKKIPKNLTCVLWGFVAIRLIFPISLESPFSLIPNSAVAPMEVISSLAEETNQTSESYKDDVNSTNHLNSNELLMNGVSAPQEQFTESATLSDPAFLTESSHITSISEKLDNVTKTVSHSSATLASTGGGISATGKTPLQTATFVASILWPIGILGMLFYAGFSYLRIRRKVREAAPLRDNIWLCDYVDSPFILGIFRPRILLPSSMTPSEMQHVIAHEQAHLKRLDHLWKPLGFVLLSIYWFNPALWVAYILLCRDIELACDEKVIKEMDTDDIKAYSTTLLNYSISRKIISVCPLAFGEVNVKRRIKNVLHYKKPAFWIILASVAACAVVAVCFLTNPKQDEQIPPAATQTAENSVKPLYTSVSFLDSGSDVLGISLQTELFGWGASELPQLAITWTNETNKNYSYRENYDLLYSNNGVWSSCSQTVPSFSTTTTVLPKKGKQEKVYTLNSFDLSRNGTYRFQVEPEEGNYIWIDFTLQNTTAEDLETPNAETLLFLVNAILKGDKPKLRSNITTMISQNQPLYDILISGGSDTVDFFVQQLENTEVYGVKEYLMALVCSKITKIGLEEGEYDPSTWWATAEDWLKIYQKTLKNADSKTYTNELLSLEFLNHYYNQSAPKDRTIELTPCFDIPGLSLLITENSITIGIDLIEVLYILIIFCISYIFEYGYEIQLDSKGKIYGDQ